MDEKNIVVVGIDTLILEHNVRGLDKKYVQTLLDSGAEAIAKLPPPKCKEVFLGSGESRYQVLDGQHTAVTQDLAGYENIEIELIQSSSALQDILIGIQGNIAHGKPFTLEEKTALIVRLKDEFGLGFGEIGKRLLMPRSTVQSRYESDVRFRTGKTPNLTEEEIQENLAKNFIKCCQKIAEEFDNWNQFNSVIDEQVHDDGGKYNAIQQVLESLSVWVGLEKQEVKEVSENS